MLPADRFVGGHGLTGFTGFTKREIGYRPNTVSCFALDRNDPRNHTKPHEEKLFRCVFVDRFAGLLVNTVL